MQWMNSTRSVLAYHLRKDAETIGEKDGLRGDLGFTPLRLVLAILDIEDIHDVRLAPEELLLLDTVEDLASAVSQAVVREQRARLNRFRARAATCREERALPSNKRSIQHGEWQ